MRFLYLCLCPLLLLLAGCGQTDEQRAANLLNRRLHDQFAGDVAAGRLDLRPVPDGAQVTFLDAVPVPGGLAVSDPGKGSLRAGLVEAMLDPAVMQVNVTDTSNLPATAKAEREESLKGYFVSLLMADVLVPDMPAADAPAGLAVTIRVKCPHRRDGSGYGDGKRKPDCF